MSGDISVIYLEDCATHAAVEAELHHEIGPSQVADWEHHWTPALQAVLRDLLARQVPMQQWPQSWHWRWDKKVATMTGMLAYQGFSVACDGMTQGLMRVDLTKSARLPAQAGKPLVYVDFLEVAPWNRSDCATTPKYRGIGTALLAAAVALSQQEDFKGRTGLHSLPQADDFYRARGMTDLGPDAQYASQLRYFEFTPEEAAVFLGDE